MTSHFDANERAAVADDAIAAPQIRARRSRLRWPEDEAELCGNIRSTPSDLKVVLKTKNDPWMLPIWLDHYLGFLNPSEIIIADNNSTDSRVEEIYENCPKEVFIFEYKTDSKNGFHNNIHCRNVFRGFHEALRASCRHVLMIDTDEFLILAQGDRWSSDRQMLLEMLERHDNRALPTLWLEAIIGSRDTCYLGDDDQRIINALAWGKPFAPSGFAHPGVRIHNGQFPRDLFDEPDDVIPVLLHLPNFLAEQRLAANREKLAARGVVTVETPHEQIAALEVSQHKDPTVIRLVKETCEILQRKSGSPPLGVPKNSVTFATGGTVTPHSAVAANLLGCLYSAPGEFMRKAFDLADAALHPAPEQPSPAPTELRRQHLNIKTEADLHNGMAQTPDLRDQYGDPTFRKELMRLLLAQGRWDEAEALVPEPGAPDAGSWHHILFARAHQKAGDKDAARTHWQAFLETHPGHAEAVAALNSATISRTPRPTLPPGMDPKAPLLPRMTDPERDMFQRALEGVENFLEFGAGGSTTLAARAGVKRIASVESDVQWLDLLAQRPEIAAVDFTALHIDIGPTGAWGMPRDPASAPKWPAYHQAVWRKLAWQPDLVLVDGRFRVACALATILNCAPDTKIVIHDFWDRPQYHVVLRYLETLERTDTLGVFRAKPTLVMKDLVSDLLAHACNPA